jgi:hypothetical protein
MWLLLSGASEMAEENRLFEEEEHPVFRHVWSGESWCPFYFAANIIDCQLDVSRGLAERILRELCAKGDIRSIRFEDMYDDPDGEELSEEPELIRPSEWLGKELDLEVKYPQIVAVSQDDLLYWLGKQPNKRQQSKQSLTLGELFALADWGQLRPQPQDRPERVSRKRSLVSKAISTLWPEGVPDAVSNPVLVHSVGNWLTDYCKRENSPKPEISGDTILRAAGRK